MSRRQLDLVYNILKLQKIVYGGWFRIKKKYLIQSFENSLCKNSFKHIFCIDWLNNDYVSWKKNCKSVRMTNINAIIY